MTNMEIDARRNKVEENVSKVSENLRWSNHNPAEGLERLGNIWDIEFNGYVDKIVGFWSVIYDTLSKEGEIKNYDYYIRNLTIEENQRVSNAIESIRNITSDKDFEFLYDVAEKKDKERVNKVLSEFLTVIKALYPEV